MLNHHRAVMTQINRFRDRTEAGQTLARYLVKEYHRSDAIVLALPRGGVPVAREISKALKAPLDVFVVRKIGLPQQPELAMGAIATGSVQLLDDTLIAQANVSPADVSAVIIKEALELQRREDLYRGVRPPPALAGRSIILVDDGVATGYTMRVAILALRKLQPSHLTVAIPVGAPDTCKTIEGLVDELICLVRPDPLHAVGLWYDHFPPVTDEEVKQEMAEAARITKSGRAK
jgi:putative phosphoribosyl transferase